MPETRAKTGNSKPRIFAPVEEITTTRKTTTSRKKKSAAGTTKANTSKPRAKTTATGRVTKKKTPAQKVKDKVEGVGLKAEGKLTGKSGKKAAGTAKVKGTSGGPKKKAPASTTTTTTTTTKKTA